MRLLISTAIVLTGVLVAAGPAIGVAAPNNRAKDIKVKVTFQNRSDDMILGDGVDNSTYQDGVGGVVAYIAASDGQLIFGTNAYNQAGRTLQFFFANCLTAPDCNAPWSSLNEKSGLQANVPGGLTAMTINEELSAWIKFNIPLDWDPAYWNVCFDSRKVVGPCAAVSGTTSTDALIRRDASNHWTVSANGTEARADLIRDSDTRRSRTYTLMGTYSMPFEFTVECVSACQ